MGNKVCDLYLFGKGYKRISNFLELQRNAQGATIHKY